MLLVGGGWVKLAVIDRLIQVENIALRIWLFLTIRVFLHLAWEWWEAEKALLIVGFWVDRYCQRHRIGVRWSWVGNLRRLGHYPLMVMWTRPLARFFSARYHLRCSVSVCIGAMFSWLRTSLLSRTRAIWTLRNLGTQATMVQECHISIPDRLGAFLRITIVATAPITGLWWQRVTLLLFGGSWAGLWPL